MVISVPPLVDNTKQNPLSTITNYNNNSNSQNQLIKTLTKITNINIITIFFPTQI